MFRRKGAAVRRFERFLLEFKANKKGVVGLAIIVSIAVMAILAPYIAPYDPKKFNVEEAWLPPSSKHLFGTNDVGQDIFSRIVYGSRISLMVGVLSAISSTLIGTFIGITAGYMGGAVDSVLSSITDIILIIPSLPLLIILVAYTKPSVWNIILVIALVGWTGTARVIRSQVLSLKEREFVEAARALGAGPLYNIFNHIFPHVFPIALIYIIMSVVGGILSEAGLSFLGLGDPTVVSWGIILYYAQARGALVRGAWWWIVFPGIAIMITGTGFVLLGNALDEIFNPRLKAVRM
ncbi:MAG TPA: ABC transporter permease [Candidatus Korarchaeota archaeon]|nr:MAG: ABC transporter permease [Candidatus Korarchaeota archaeon]HDI73663.1 ABC transporter permease [Candidatus Korarchaeota archaeon]